MNFHRSVEHFSPEERWIIQLLFQNSKDPWEDSLGDEKRAVDFALGNGLGPLLYAHTVSTSLSEHCRFSLKKQYLSNLARNSTFQVISDEMMETLKQVGIKCILLKGSFLSRMIYPDPALRPMSDIDLLVPDNYVEEAFLMFETDSSALLKRDRFGHHLPPLMYRGAMIEIHNSLFDLNAKYQIPMNLVWRDAKVLSDGGFLVMNPLHLITHLILHIYYSFRIGGIRLGWFYDLKVTMEFYKSQVSTEDLSKFFRVHKLEKPTSLVLAYYQFLNPDSEFHVHVDKSLGKRLLEIQKFAKNPSAQNKFKYGYSVAWERILYSKNWRQRWSFIKHLLLVDKSGEHLSFFRRIFYLTINTCRLLWQKIRFW